MEDYPKGWKPSRCFGDYVIFTFTVPRYMNAANVYNIVTLGGGISNPALLGHTQFIVKICTKYAISAIITSLSSQHIIIIIIIIIQKVIQEMVEQHTWKHDIKEICMINCKQKIY
jgi:hypothetical protein